MHFGMKWIFSQGVSSLNKDGNVSETCGQSRRARTVREQYWLLCISLEITYDGAKHGGKKELTLRASAIGSFSVVLRK